MRISTAQIHQGGIDSILAQQTRLSKTQLQVATGERILTPSDDPVGAVRMLDLAREIAIVDQYQRNGEMARTQLSLEDSALTASGNVLQRVRELTLQANNDVLSVNDRRAIAVEMQAKLDELLALANSRDANGDYLFAGYQTGSQPFTISGGAVVYSGDQGQRLLQVGPAMQISVADSGAQVFQLIPTGNGVYDIASNAGNTGSAIVGTTSVNGVFVPDSYTLTFSQTGPGAAVTYQVVGAASGVVASGTYRADEAIVFGGAKLTVSGAPANGDSFTVAPARRQDIFTSLSDMIAALQNSGSDAASKAQFHNAMNRGLNNVDQALDHMLRVRGDVGARLNNLDSQQNINEDYILQLEQTLSSVKDLDYAEAISRLNLQMVALEAAQQAFVKTQGLSLFNFL